MLNDCDSPEQIQPSESCPVCSHLYHSFISNSFLYGLHTDHLDFLIHWIKWKASITQRERDHKIQTYLFFLELLLPMVQGSGEYEAGEQIVFQSTPNSWSGLRSNHHFSKFFIAHQSTSIDHLVLIIICNSSSFSSAVLAETLSRNRKSSCNRDFISVSLSCEFSLQQSPHRQFSKAEGGQKRQTVKYLENHLL